MPNNNIQWTISYPLLYANWGESDSASPRGSGEVIVFQPASGDLHLITVAGAAVLELLSGHALSAVEIVIRLSGDPVLSSQITSSSQVTEAILLPFHKLGLVKRLAS